MLAILLERQPVIGLIAFLLLIVFGRLTFLTYRLVVVLVALHGAEPKDRPESLRAAAELLRPWPRLRSRAGRGGRTE